ncbi:MAG: hypothetical protein J6S15_04575 [Clostridia bacterium]|nr:hypothetical protein [Clostridia bacterium]
MSELMNEVTQQESIPAETAFLEEAFGAEGWGTKLLTPISKVSFYSERTANAFKTFAENVSLGEQFTLAELLTTPEALYSRYEVVAKEGYAVYLLREAVPDIRLMASLMRNSVPGLWSLLYVTKGVELSLPADMTIEKLCQSRFLLLRERDGDRFCASQLIKMNRVGTLTPDNFRFLKNGVCLFQRSIATLLPTLPVELSVGAEAEEIYWQYFNSTMGYSCCHMDAGEYYVNLPASLPLADFLAGCLGVFSAMMRFRFSMPPMRFAKEKNGLVVPRPTVLSGDGVFAFRPKCGADGLPHPAELMKLVKFLSDGVKSGKIKSVLPLKKNAQMMMDRLADEDLTYVSEREFPTEGFSVLAILPAGSDVPATKLGSFQYK